MGLRFVGGPGCASVLLAAAAACGSPARVAPGAEIPLDSTCWLVEPPVVAAESLRLVIDGRDAASREGGRWLLASVTTVGSELHCSATPGLLVDSWRVEAGGDRLVSDDGRAVIAIAGLGDGDDARDAIDAGADLLVTADAGVARYARAAGALVVPLSSRTIYGALVVSVPALDLVAAGRLGEDLAGDLLPDGTLVAARTLEAPSSTCVVERVAPNAPPAVSLIVYQGGDGIARALAERLVSLAAAGDSTVRQLVGNGMPAVSAVAVSRATPVERVAWSPPPPAVVAWPAADAPPCVNGALPVPLVEAASWLVVRQGAVGVTSGANGTLRLVLPAAGKKSP